VLTFFFYINLENLKHQVSTKI